VVKIVAEMSGNHNGSLERALAIAEAAAKAGCYALKLQTYTADSMTIDSDREEFLIKDPSSLWYGYKLYDLYKKAATPYEWHEIIFKKCHELGLICFSTPFDPDAVDFLEKLNCPIYKIASFENEDWPLLKKVASTKKPVIMSVGMLLKEEINESVELLLKCGCSDLTLLKCTSTYPASPKNCNLLTISDLIKNFPQCKIGLSDHTLGIGVAIASVVLGVQLIEKHFTLSHNDDGVDSAFSTTPDEMAILVQESQNAEDALGKVNYSLSEDEKKSVSYRRSIYVVKEMKQGDVITQDNIRIIRPNLGIKPIFYDALIGKKIIRDIKAGEPLRESDIEDCNRSCPL